MRPHRYALVPCGSVHGELDTVIPEFTVNSLGSRSINHQAVRENASIAETGEP